MRRAVLCLVAAFAVAPPVIGSDVLMLAGGERRTGALTSCDDEHCRLDGAAVALADLVWIGLGVGEEAPPKGIAAPGAVVAPAAGALAAGRSLIAGRLLGISQGVVVLDTAELERRQVRWVRVAEVPPPVDVLVRRDGALRTGALQGCAAGGCTMAGTTTTRADLAWIALGASPETIVVPQAPQDPARDQAELADGSTRVTPLIGVGTADVVLGSGTFPRAEIAWIYLAPPAAEPGGGPVYRPSPPEPGSPQGPAPPPTSPGGQPAPGPPAPGSPAGSPGERGALWTGTLTARAYGNADDVYSEWNVTIDVRLREYSNPWHCWNAATRQAPRVGTLLRLLPEGSVVRNSFRCSGPYVSCSGSGAVTVSAAEGEDGLTQPAAIYLRTRDVDTSDCQIFDVPLGGGSYFLGVGTRPSDTFPVTWVSESGSSTEPTGFLPLVAGWSPVLPTTECADREVRNLEGGGGVMRGSYTGPCTGCCPNLAMSWSVCREGAACPPPPELPAGASEEFDPCGRSGQQAALRDTCHAQLDALLDGLAPALAEYNAEMKLAEDNRAEFERAQDFCELYDKAKEVLEAILSGGTGPAAEAARALVYLRDVIEKVQDGELATMLYPEQVATYLGYYEKAKAIWFEVTASEIDKMQRDLDGCSGKVPIDTYMAAKKFLEHFSAAKRVWDSKVSPGLNDLRSKGLECAGLDHAAWRACFDDAECRGVPPACGPEPSLEGAYD